MQNFDVSKHMLVPKHSGISEKEKAELLKKYSITIRELPRINACDPALAGLDVKEGDIIKITRKSSSAAESIFYRRVARG